MPDPSSTDSSDDDSYDPSIEIESYSGMPLADPIDKRLLEKYKLNKQMQYNTFINNINNVNTNTPFDKFEKELKKSIIV